MELPVGTKMLGEPGPKSLAKKLSEVMAAVERIPKHGRNTFHNYDYATEADIVAAIRGELSKRSVILLPAITGRSREPVGEKGSVLTHLDMEFTFIDGDSGEMITRPWLGVGSDKDDKAGYKAMTGGEKYFLLKTFLIPTGDDPEQEGEQPPAGKRPAKPGLPTRPAAAAPSPAAAGTRPPVTVGNVTVSNVTVAKISDAQRKRFYAVAKEHGWTKDEAAALIKRVLGVNSSADIPTHRYKEIVGILEAGVDSMAANP